MRELDIARSIAPCLADLSEQALEVMPVEDFAQLDVLYSQTGRRGQTPILNVDRLDLTSSQAFWLFLMDDGVAVGGVACKVIDLGKESFGNYLSRVLTAQYQRTQAEVKFVAQPVIDQIGGKVIYFGELELREGYRGRRKTLASFARLAKSLAAMRWPDFDWMCAIIPDNHFHLAKDYGFTWLMPNAIGWNEPAPAPMLSSHWLMANERSHFEHEVWSRMHAVSAQKPS